MITQEKVLVVEDEENERTGLAELISAWGYRTDTAKDGLEGLEKVAAWSPGIVVTDFKMPRMNGIELLQRLAEQPQRIAVILLTAQGSIDIAVDAMKAGAYDFIQKPVEPSRLKQILQNAARQRGKGCAAQGRSPAKQAKAIGNGARDPAEKGRHRHDAGRRQAKPCAEGNQDIGERSCLGFDEIDGSAGRQKSGDRA